MLGISHLQTTVFENYSKVSFYNNTFEANYFKFKSNMLCLNFCAKNLHLDILGFCSDFQILFCDKNPNSTLNIFYITFFFKTCHMCYVLKGLNVLNDSPEDYESVLKFDV